MNKAFTLLVDNDAGSEGAVRENAPSRDRFPANASRASRVFATLLLVVFLISCGRKEPVPIEEPPEKPNSAQKVTAVPAIVAIQSNIRVPPAEALSVIVAVLQQRGIAIGSADMATATVESRWVETTDKLCNLSRSSSAPMVCRVRFLFHADQLGGGSKLSSKYEELCDAIGQLPLECPASNAEKLLKAIVADVESNTGG